MPIIDETGRKHWRIRVLTACMYLLLAGLGVTMVYPFLITLTSSISNALDYQRYAPYPRWVVSREERFVRGLVRYFPEGLRGGMDQLTVAFENVPAPWGSWQIAGMDRVGIDTFAQSYLKQAENPTRWQEVQTTAADYQRFVSTYPLDDSICAYDSLQMPHYFRTYYEERAAEEAGHALGLLGREEKALAALSRHWEVPFTTFYEVVPGREFGAPMDQPNYWPPQDGRAKAFTDAMAAYRQGYFLPKGIAAKWGDYLRSDRARTVLGLTGSGPVTLDELNKALGTQYRSWGQLPRPGREAAPKALGALWQEFLAYQAPISETRPFALKATWLRYLGTPSGRQTIGLPEGGSITIEEYNQAFGTTYPSLRETPFPIPASAPAKLQNAWETFVQTQYPLRLVTVRLSPALQANYRQFVTTRFHGNLQRCNETLRMAYRSWNDVVCPATMPVENDVLSNLWMEYVAKLPRAAKEVRSADVAYQQFLLTRYGSVSAINKAYGWNLSMIEQAQLPVDDAYLVTFVRNERTFITESLAQNFRFVFEYLFLRGRAILNTLVLIALALLAALTVNPLAAYALSRFNMRQMPAIILFLLATMAFPAAVSMIPGYLLMRDLHLLNTYWALVLPGMANGMSIFLLKGFFDSLPQELYEAAALDGAKEWQVFLRITLPLSKPILAVITLNSFIAAYNGWEWALVVCQKQEMWTIAVWLYQFNTLMAASQPWAVMASFIITSLPVFLVFLLCQNVILRGIVLPQMK